MIKVSILKYWSQEGGYEEVSILRLLDTKTFEIEDSSISDDWKALAYWCSENSKGDFKYLLYAPIEDVVDFNNVLDVARTTYRNHIETNHRRYERRQEKKKQKKVLDRKALYDELKKEFECSD